MNSQTIRLVECPRDAMQGIKAFIPTEMKIEYINSLLAVGFDTVDFGSFVSPKAIPQMADTHEVVRKLEIGKSHSKLLAIVANLRGAEEAVEYDEISNLGFPFSISPTFQLRNTNSTMEESMGRVEDIQALCIKHNKTLVVYLSMGFGNPYGDPYNQDVLISWADKMVHKDIKIISLADTVGIATPAQVSFALDTLIPKYPDIEIGVHLHSTPANWKQKMEAALGSNCTRFDGALKGIGGCPMAGNELVGNMNTELMINYLEQKKLNTGLNMEALEKSLLLANRLFD